VPDNSIEAAVAELKQSAKELARAAAHLSRKVAAKTGDAAKDPPGTAKRAAHAVAHELDNLAKEVEKILRDL
jgi:uncharacterized protein YoxC